MYQHATPYVIIWQVSSHHILFMYYFEEYSSFLARLQWQEASLYGSNFYTDMNPAQWILMTVIRSDFSSSAIMTLTLVIWGEMSWQLLDLICSDIYSMFRPWIIFFNPLIFHPVPSPAHHISNLSNVLWTKTCHISISLADPGYIL